MQTSIDDFLGAKQEDKYRKVLFRSFYDFDTDYATHGLYWYPARFIPHVVRYFIERYTKLGDLVFDPFAGSGTVAIEAEITGRNYVVWDLNPITELLVKAETWRGDINEKMFEVDFNYPKKFVPRWDNLYLWHPREFVDALSRLWAYYHDHSNPLLAIPLLRVTKYFSYAEIEFPKPYRSKVAMERVKELLSGNWREKMRDMYRQEVERVIKKVKEFQKLCKCTSKGEVKGGVDVLNAELPKADAIITSPPYLQAQEYIRTFSMELHWLGYTDAEIRKLKSKEIPYNTPPNVSVNSDTYKKYRELVRKVGDTKLLQIYDAYFKSMAYFLNKVDAKVIGLFVGPVKVKAMRVPLDEIFKEHFESLGWSHEVTLIDTIVSRRLAKVEINPATGLEDERTPTEHLLIMRRNQ
jgi:DNA modification methylase